MSAPSHEAPNGHHATSSLYSGDLNTKLVEYFNGWKEVGCLMVWFSNAIWIPDTQTIWILDKWMHLVFFCTGPVQGITHRLTIWILNFLKSELQKYWYSNVSGIQKSGFQIPTIFGARFFIQFGAQDSTLGPSSSKSPSHFLSSVT